MGEGELRGLLLMSEVPYSSLLDGSPESSTPSESAVPCAGYVSEVQQIAGPFLVAVLLSSLSESAVPCTGYLSEVQQIAGPFLVVVPLSTVPNWIREFRKWVPSLNSIVYVGDGQSREVRRLHVLSWV